MESTVYQTPMRDDGQYRVTKREIQGIILCTARNVNRETKGSGVFVWKVATRKQS